MDAAGDPSIPPPPDYPPPGFGAGPPPGGPPMPLQRPELPPVQPQPPATGMPPVPPPTAPPPGYAPPTPPPPGYAPPGYAPPGYAPPGYAPPGYAPPGYAPPGYAAPPAYPAATPPTEAGAGWSARSTAPTTPQMPTGFAPPPAPYTPAGPALRGVSGDVVGRGGSASLALGTGAAIVGGVVGALAWGLIIAATHVKVGYLALLVGIIVGFAMRAVAGYGGAQAVIAAVIALLACCAGYVIATYVEISSATGLSFGEAVSSMSVPDVVNLRISNGDPLDVLFLGLAVWAAWRTASPGGMGRRRR